MGFVHINNHRNTDLTPLCIHFPRNIEDMCYISVKRKRRRKIDEYVQSFKIKYERIDDVMLVHGRTGDWCSATLSSDWGPRAKEVLSTHKPYLF